MRYFHQERIQNAYIDYDVRDGQIDAGWAHPSILQALAHIQHIALYMWRVGENDVLIPHQVGDENYAIYIPSEASSRADLLFVDGNHFDRLEFYGYEAGIPGQGIAPLLVSSSLRSSTGTAQESWAWVTTIMEGAQLPWLGLPIHWNKTKEKRMRTAFDPSTKTTIDLNTGKSSVHKISPVGFIDSTKGKNVMPGALAPASARIARYLEPCLHEAVIQGAQGQHLAPCIAHGDYVKVEALQADHAQAKTEIQARQEALVAHLNEDKAFATFVMSLSGIDKFFVKVEDRYYGTLFFYELYFNDIDNIWLICEACNLHKSDQDTVTWLKDQWLYGDEFLDYLGLINDTGILTKVRNNQGLAEVAIQWYWERHANYASIAKKLMQDVVTPIQILNQRVDRVVGLVRAGANERRLQRHLASLDFRVALLSEIANIKGIDMPRADSESPHSSSDSDNYLRIADDDGRIIPVTLENYKKSTTAFKSEFIGNIQERLAAKIKSAVDLDEDSANNRNTDEEKHNIKKPKLGGT